MFKVTVPARDVLCVTLPVTKPSTPNLTVKLHPLHLPASFYDRIGQLEGLTVIDSQPVQSASSSSVTH